MLPRSKKRPIKSNGSVSDRYALMIVNITDSAQRSLDNYIRKQNEINSVPSIKFCDTNGEIRIPESDQTSANFTFAIQPRNESGQGRFTCIQERKSSQPRAGSEATVLESLGQIGDRIVVRAKDDIFERTRKKILIAEEIRQKTRTKLLENEFKNTKLTGRQLIASGNVGGAGAAAAAAVAIGRKSAIAPSKKVTMMVTTAAVLAAAAEKPRIVKRPPPSQQQQQQQQPQQQQSHQLLSDAANDKKLCVRRKKTFLRDIKRVPLKERLIHLLALRTATKLEIVSRIRDVEGIAGKLPASITTILNEIAYFKNNKYELKRHMWNEVREDWPHYSESERQLLERRKPNNLTPLESDESLRKSSDSKLTSETIATNKTIATVTTNSSSGYESLQSMLKASRAEPQPKQLPQQKAVAVVATAAAAAEAEAEALPPKKPSSDLNMPSLDCFGGGAVASASPDPNRVQDPRLAAVSASAAQQSRKRPFPYDQTSNSGQKRRKLSAAYDLPLPEFAKLFSSTIGTKNECLPNEKPNQSRQSVLKPPPQQQPPPPTPLLTAVKSSIPGSKVAGHNNEPSSPNKDGDDEDDELSAQLNELDRKLVQLRDQMSDPARFISTNDVCLLIQKTVAEFPLKFHVPRLVSPGHGVNSVVVATAVPAAANSAITTTEPLGRKRISFDAYRKRLMNSNENHAVVVVDDDDIVDESADVVDDQNATNRTDDDNKSDDRNSSLMAFPVYEADYLTEFGPIESQCQFKRYLNEFHRVHPVYEKLRIVVNCAATTFREFDLQRYKIEKITKNVERHDKFLKFAHDIAQLRNLYTVCGYNEIRGMYDYIEGKLAHIRSCLIDYYAKQTTSHQ